MQNVLTYIQLAHRLKVKCLYYVTLLNPLRATSYRPPVMKTWQPQPELNHEHINLQQLKPGWEAKLERKEV